MDPYSNPWIDIKINHINLQSSEAFAKLLFNLNTGQYKTSMIDCLINLSSNNTRLESTINNIVLIWEELLSEKIDHISENKPIISPKNTFTSSNK
jgi:hypothetical protein